MTVFASLRSRLWLTYAVLIAVALSVVAAIFLIYLLRNPFLYRQAIQKLSVVQGVLLARQEEWLDLPLGQMEPLLARQGKALQVRILMLDTSRNVLLDTERDSAPALQVRRLLRLNQTVYDAQGNAWLFNYKKMTNQTILILAVPRPRVALLNIVADELFQPIFYSGLAALALALFLAFWVARWVADPLQKVVTAASQFPGGLQTLPLEGPQEVRELTGAYNLMTARVQASQKSQREFVANVSHELKTPLTSIQGFAQAILDGTAVTPQEREHAAQIIFDESGRMYRLVLDLLDLARLETGTADLKRAELDLGLLVTTVVGRFDLQARSAGVTLEVFPSPQGLPALPGDGDRLAQVFTNLVENALKFTPAGGKITVQIARQAGGAEVQVQDSGAGIAPEALPHIFDRFYQADLARSGGENHGAGLGLAIAWEIVAAHGGKIIVRSAPGQGSLFSVWLPFSGPEFAASA
jgi:signal transduction histidine kinase